MNNLNEQSADRKMYSVFLLSLGQARKNLTIKLCTKPKHEPPEEFRFAVAYREGTNQHRTSKGGHASKEIKNESVFAVNERKTHEAVAGRNPSKIT